MRRQPRDPAEVQPSVAEHLEQDGMLTRRPRHGDAEIGLVLPQAENSPAVFEHRRARLAGIEPPALHLCDMSDHLGLGSSRLLHQE
jgi:hypothetical protein